MTERLRHAIAEFVSAFPVSLRPLVLAKLTALIDALLEEIRT